MLGRSSSRNSSNGVTFWLALFAVFSAKGQFLNYVSNGSFEALNSFSTSTKYNAVEYWQPIDSGKFSDYLVTLLPPIANGPYALGFQYPRTGYNYDVTEVYNYRGYPRNRLKRKLEVNATYCARLHVVSTNSNPYAIGSLGMYFADETLDTIEYCNSALSYLSPQIEHPVGNFITDTLNWIPISGTFVATGSEKYLVIGNFRSDANTQTLLINPTYSNDIGSVYGLDDVSCIEIDPRYAGRDTTIFIGDSIFIGKYSDEDWLDVRFSWFSLPAMTKIDSTAGFWVKPAETSSYVVKFEVCNYTIWDTITVAVKVDDTGFAGYLKSQLSVYPIPANDFIKIETDVAEYFRDFHKVAVVNALGLEVLTSDLNLTEGRQLLDVRGLDAGAYILLVRGSNGEQISKRALIAR